jgi:hypothetical protein
MQNIRNTFQHTFAGGWDISRGPSAEVGVTQDGRVPIPFLSDVSNCVYTIDGGIRKAPGLAKLNTSALASGANVMGLYDFWRQGTSGTPQQYRIAHAGTEALADNGDGSFTALFTGLQADRVPAYTQLDDRLILSSDSTIDVPKSYDGTTAQDLAGSPPNFAFATVYKNRVWAGGDPLFPSRLYYSALLDGEDWIGAGSGTIDIDPGDGDKLTGLRSHKNSLFVFKGPNKGSIHRITGSAPIGDDGFARITFIRGLGGAGHNSIFAFRDDLGFLAPDGSIRSLAATERFGDFIEAALSQPIEPFLTERANAGQYRLTWAVTDPTRGITVIALPVDGSTTNNYALMLDQRFDPPRWAPWPYLQAPSLALVVHKPFFSNTRGIMAGGTDGFIRTTQSPNRSIDTNGAYEGKIRIPWLNYGAPNKLKTFAEASIGMAEKGNYDLTFGWTGDAGAQQTKAISMRAGEILDGIHPSGVTTVAAEARGTSNTAFIANSVDGPPELPLTSQVLFPDDGYYDLRIAISPWIFKADPTGSFNGSGEWELVETTGAASFTGTPYAKADGTYFIFMAGGDPFDSANQAISATYSTYTAPDPYPTGLFTLGTSRLSGFRHIDKRFDLETGGEFVDAQYEMSNALANQDFEIHSFSVTLDPGPSTTE